MKIKITSKRPFFDFNIKELIHYKDLIWLFVKKNYATRYKQTVLGPLWILLTPILSILLYTVIFGKIAGLSTDSIPALVFYLSGTVIWNYFYSCVNGNSNIFILNANLFSKIYFPRLTNPISTIVTAFFDFLIQSVLLIVVIVFYLFNGFQIHFTKALFFLPIILLELSLFGLSIGLFFSSLNIKYRDLSLLFYFFMQLWMYLCPVVYSISIVPEKFKFLYFLNPVSTSIVIFRNSIFGIDYVSYKSLLINCIFTMFCLFFSLLIFKKVEKDFVDLV